MKKYRVFFAYIFLAGFTSSCAQPFRYFPQVDFKQVQKIQASGISPKPATISWELNIALIEFLDIKGDPDYTKRDFENLLFGDDYTKRSPDHEAVFGSVKAYFETISHNNFSIHGKVLNKEVDGHPQWIRVGYTKKQCMDMGLGGADTVFVNAAKNAFPDSITPSKKICYIYAGNKRINKPEDHPELTGGLHPHASSPDYYVVSEKTDSDWSTNNMLQETDKATFCHIGLHCHEIGHLLGISHSDESAGRWCAMRGGDVNGPRIGSCPAPFNPISRKALGWLSYLNISATSLNQKIEYGSQYAYKIADMENDPGKPYELIIEHRKASDFNKYVCNKSLSNKDLGIFMWIKGTTETSSMSLITADDSNVYMLAGGSLSALTDELKGDPFPGTHHVTSISDYTRPDLSNGVTFVYNWKPHILIENIRRSDAYSTVDVHINYFGENF